MYQYPPNLHICTYSMIVKFVATQCCSRTKRMLFVYQNQQNSSVDVMVINYQVIYTCIVRENICISVLIKLVCT